MIEKMLSQENPVEMRILLRVDNVSFCGQMCSC